MQETGNWEGRNGPGARAVGPAEPEAQGRESRGILGRLRIPIRSKVLVTLVTLATLCSVIVSSTLISYFHDDKTTYIRDLEVDLASNTALSVESLLDLYQERLRGMGNIIETEADLSAALTEQLQRQQDCLYLGVYDRSRERLAGVTRYGALELAGIDAVRFDDSRAKLGVSPFYVTSQKFVVANSTAGSSLPSFSLIMPGRDAATGDDRFLRADFLLDPMLRAIKRAPGFSTYIVEAGGTVFAHADPASVASRQLPVERAYVESLLESLGGARAGSSEFTRGGEPYLVSFAAVGSGSLAVVVERPKSDAYLAAAELRKRSVRAATVIIVVAVVLSILLSRALTVRLLALSAAAKRLEQGDLDVQVDCRYSHDELGDLGRTFNMAAKGLKEREQQVRETYEELIQSEKLASIGRMSAGIVHEIKNPLTAILTYAELASMELPEGHKLAPRLDTIASETLRCKDILDGLLSMSRKQTTDLHPVELHDVIRRVTEVTAAQIRVSQVDLDLSLKAKDDCIVGDDNQLSQVLMNLVLNAIDAMEDSPVKRLKVSTELTDSERIVVRLRDTGHGMPKDVQERVFDPFFTTKGKGKGTGLGLSVTYGIVSEHSGSIRVLSEPEQGTEFILTLPLAAAARCEPEEEAVTVAG